MEIVYRKLEEIKPYEKNPRDNEEAVKYVAESIKEFGFKNPIIIDKEDVIVCGHTRLKAAERLGLKEVPTIKADDLTPEQIKAFRLADNKVSEKATWNMDLLTEELQNLDIDMSNFGFEEELSMDIQTEIVEDDYNVEENIPVEPKAKLGDIYELGEHRLMCGDSTSEEDTEKLAGGVSLDLLFTDPPYNVSIVGGSHALPAFKRRKAGKHTIQNDSMSDEDFKEFLNRAFNNANKLLKDGGAFYVWYATREQVNFEEQLTRNAMPVREQLIWVKNSLVLGRQDYQWQHEPCMYGWKDGASHYFVDNRKLTTIIEDKLDFEKMSKNELKELLEEIYEFPSTIIRENRPVKSDMHPTMKPVRMCAKLISNSTKPNETVLDLFGGSGSTLIACEQLGRKCYMMEYDPKYVDVIIDRWEQFTGKKAIKIN